ncbi:MAG: hypothetical protein M3331_06245 [Actinomycetota bacterium]|nr:hypothetical protein [Actinomycetota bacterium]
MARAVGNGDAWAMNMQQTIELGRARGIHKLSPELASLGLGVATGSLLTGLVVGIGWALTLLGA